MRKLVNKRLSLAPTARYVGARSWCILMPNEGAGNYSVAVCVGVARQQLPPVTDPNRSQWSKMATKGPSIGWEPMYCFGFMRLVTVHLPADVNISM